MSIWENTPLPGEIIAQLERLEAKRKKRVKWIDKVKHELDWDAKAPRPIPDDTQFIVRPKRPTWSITDPQGQLESISPTNHFFIHHVDLSAHWSYPLQGSVPDEIHFGSASESIDITVDGKRIVFYILGVGERSQFYFGVNLLENDEDPVIYSTDHYPMEPAPAYSTLSHFLSRISMPQ